jgi:hypothetical protein
MVEKKIAGRSIRCNKLLATHGLKLQARLVRFMGPAIGKLSTLLAAMREDSVPGAVTGAAAAAVIAEMFMQRDPDEFVVLVKDICSVAEARADSGAYDPVDIDELFPDGVGPELIELVVFVLKVQFADFFSALLRDGTALMKRQGPDNSPSTKSNESRPISTGRSGARS